jgi:hypothetical protein
MAGDAAGSIEEVIRKMATPTLVNLAIVGEACLWEEK